MLCPPDTVEALKVINRGCTLEDFTTSAADLNKDGKMEWLFFGPQGECGVHGNCPIAILTQEGSAWKALGAPDCTDQECLSWANSFASEVLSSSHAGYRDLLIAGDMGSFYWTKDVYEWNGRQYRRKAHSTTYFLYDSDAEKLRKVSKAQWDSCVKGGKGCL